MLVGKDFTHFNKTVIDSIHIVKKCFTIATKDIKIRPYQEQDVAYIIDRQLSLYESERQFTTEIWKKYLTRGVISLVEKFNPEKIVCLFWNVMAMPPAALQ